jgi:transcriptional regulator with GAF, ATPase, and Fis domain
MADPTPLNGSPDPDRSNPVPDLHRRRKAAEARVQPLPLHELTAIAVLEMARERSVQAVAESVTALVVEAIAACDASAVVLFEDTAPSSVVTSDPAIGSLLEGQERGSGPALTAFLERTPVQSSDLAIDGRWPAYAQVLTDALGISSLYALPLQLHDNPCGVLILYAKAIDGFDRHDLETARILAAHATVAVSDAMEREQLQAALDSRTAIGQAIGIVMERFTLDATTAFGVLRRLSQTQNTKLRDLAARIVETGQLD